MSELHRSACETVFDGHWWKLQGYSHRGDSAIYFYFLMSVNKVYWWHYSGVSDHRVLFSNHRNMESHGCKSRHWTLSILLASLKSNAFILYVYLLLSVSLILSLSFLSPQSHLPCCDLDFLAVRQCSHCFTGRPFGFIGNSSRSARQC